MAFWSSFIINMPQSFKHHLEMTLFAILFAGKLRRCLFRYRKRRQLIEEWLDLQTNNIACIAVLTQKVTACRLSKTKAEAVLCGLEAISNQSHITIQKLQAVLLEKGMEFGSRIVEICVSFEAYQQFLRKHVERQMIMKEIEREPVGWKLEHLGAASDKITIEETAQKIVLRTYQLSLLVGKYFKCLRKGNEVSYFQNAINVLTNINKKHDYLLRVQQKLKEKERIERLLNMHLESNFIYSQKCHWHMGQAILHVFETMVALESEGRWHCFELDQYCSVFSKSYDDLHMGCLVTKTNTVHFLFAFGRQLGKFVRVLDNLIHVNDGKLRSSQASGSIFPPFMAAQVVDFRQGSDLRGNQREQFTIIFSAIVQDAPSESDHVRSSMRESGLNWSDVKFCSQPQQLNETVTLGLDDLQKTREICEYEYGLQRKLPELKNFSGQASQRLLKMLQWESLLNCVLRSRTAINNPILLLKQLQVTDVFLESSLSRTTLPFHCRLCACFDASSLDQFFRRRLRFLARKYGGQEKEYCYFIFQKIRQQVNKVSQYELTNYSQLIALRQLRSGRMDYSFRKRVVDEKKWFVMVMLLGVEECSFEVEVNQYTLVNQVIDQICLLSNVPAMFAFRLAVCFEDQELLLKPNELVFPLLDHYNIKCNRSYSPTFFSKFKSFGRLIQFSENGMLVLKQVIFYPLSKEEQVYREWEEQFMAYQFKYQKLIGLPRESRLDIIVLLTIRHLIKKERELPAILTDNLYERYVPNSLEQQIQENKSQLQKLYNLRKGLNKSEICELIQVRLSASPFYRSYVWEMRVRDMKEGLTNSKKKVKGVMVGVGWLGINILSLNGIPVFHSSWSDCSISLGTAGLTISTEDESITLKGLQLYQTYWLCREYKGLTEQASVLKGR